MPCMAKSCLPSLSLHALNVCQACDFGGGSRMHPGLRSSKQLLARGVQGWRWWPGTVTLPLETFVHWRREPSVWHLHHVTAIVMPILPADHVHGPPQPCPLSCTSQSRCQVKRGPQGLETCGGAVDRRALKAEPGHWVCAACVQHAPREASLCLGHGLGGSVAARGPALPFVVIAAGFV